jgi:hypothetical protein
MSIGVRYAQQGLMPAYQEASPPRMLSTSLPYGGTRQRAGQVGGQAFLQGTAISVISTTPTNEQWTLNVAGATGTITLNWSFVGGTASCSFAQNAPLTTVLGAVTGAIASWGNGNLVITGTPGSNYIFTFANELANNAIGGGWFAQASSGTPTWTNTQLGSSSCQYDVYNASFNNNPVDGFLEWDVRTGASGERLSKDIGGPAVNTPSSWPYYNNGIFLASQLIGLDANAFTLGGLVKKAGGFLVELR